MNLFKSIWVFFSPFKSIVKALPMPVPKLLEIRFPKRLFQAQPLKMSFPSSQSSEMSFPSSIYKSKPMKIIFLTVWHCHFQSFLLKNSNFRAHLMVSCCCANYIKKCLQFFCKFCLAQKRKLCNRIFFDIWNISPQLCLCYESFKPLNFCFTLETMQAKMH